MTGQLLHSVVDVGLFTVGHHDPLSLEQHQVPVCEIKFFVITNSSALESVDGSAHSFFTIVIEKFFLWRVLGHIHTKVGHVLSGVHTQTVACLLADVLTSLASRSSTQSLPLLGVVLHVSVLLEAVSGVLGTGEFPRGRVGHH